MRREEKGRGHDGEGRDTGDGTIIPNVSGQTYFTYVDLTRRYVFVVDKKIGTLS